jgi:hypothetical protein
MPTRGLHPQSPDQGRMSQADIAAPIRRHPNRPHALRKSSRSDCGRGGSQDASGHSRLRVGGCWVYYFSWDLHSPSVIGADKPSRLDVRPYRALARRTILALAAEPFARAPFPIRNLTGIAGIRNGGHRRHSRRRDHPDLPSELPHPRRAHLRASGRGTRCLIGHER